MAEKEKEILENICEAITMLSPDGKDQLLAYSGGFLAGLNAQIKKEEEEK